MHDAPANAAGGKGRRVTSATAHSGTSAPLSPAPNPGSRAGAGDAFRAAAAIMRGELSTPTTRTPADANAIV